MPGIKLSQRYHVIYFLKNFVNLFEGEGENKNLSYCGDGSVVMLLLDHGCI